jgi:hypothetical protein
MSSAASLLRLLNNNPALSGSLPYEIGLLTALTRMYLIPLFSPSASTACSRPLLLLLVLRTLPLAKNLICQLDAVLYDFLFLSTTASVSLITIVKTNKLQERANL